MPEQLELTLHWIKIINIIIKGESKLKKKDITLIDQLATIWGQQWVQNYQKLLWIFLHGVLPPYPCLKGFLPTEGPTKSNLSYQSFSNQCMIVTVRII